METKATIKRNKFVVSFSEKLLEFSFFKNLKYEVKLILWFLPCDILFTKCFYVDLRLLNYHRYHIMENNCIILLSSNACSVTDILHPQTMSIFVQFFQVFLGKYIGRIHSDDTILYVFYLGI